MPRAKSHVPEGLHTVTPHLSVKHALDAIAFYEKAFGAQVRSVAPGPAPGTVMHAEIRIGDSIVFLADEMPMSTIRAPTTAGATTVMLNVFVPDCDALYQQAIAAGATGLMPPATMFWGDRYAQLSDPFGHVWAIATHLEDLSPEETQQRAQAFFAQMGGR